MILNYRFCNKSSLKDFKIDFLDSLEPIFELIKLSVCILNFYRLVKHLIKNVGRNSFTTSRVRKILVTC
jgi:hypothetical protein